MKKPKVTHKERVKKIKDYSKSSPVYLIGTIIAIVFVIFALIGNFSSRSPDTPTEITETSDIENTDSPPVTEAVTKREIGKFEIGVLDVGILVLGGAFCLLMIYKERRKGGQGRK
jgi:hypothetical protein